MSVCENKAFSDDYADFIASNSVSERILRENYYFQCISNVDNKYLIGYVIQNEVGYSIGNPGITIPRLFVPMQESALSSTQVYRVRNNPFLDLRGRGVLIGFVDTGID